MNEEFIVSILEDENDGDFSTGDLSLREAIALAESGETIAFDSNLSGGTITLALGELAIDKSLTIQGLGAENILIDGGGLDNFFDGIRVFNINDNSDTESQVVINDLTIAGGGAFVNNAENPSGAGIFNTENLEINNAVIRDNTADLSGGGIYSEGTLTVNNSAIYNNEAQRRSSGGGISNAGTATINQSTIANNSVNARASGGGISNNGTLTVSNSTVSGNLGGIYNEVTNDGEATIISTIVAGNINNNDLESNITSGGNNLIGGDSISSLDLPGNLVNAQDSDIVGEPDVFITDNLIDNSIDALLGELQDNGGPTPTIALLDGSPAIDAGSNPSNLETDQRGTGFDRTVGEATDIGAFEVQDGDGGETPTDLVVSILEDENDGDFSAEDLSLREAIALAEAGDTITFNSDLSGGSIVLSQGELVVDKSLIISGLGASNLTISGNNESRVLLIDDGDANNQADVSISELTIANGNSDVAGTQPDINGGGILNRESLLLFNSAVRDNDAANGGAIYNDNGSRFEIQNSLVSNNDSSSGAILNLGSSLILNSTIGNNNNNVGISAISNLNGGELELTNSTVANNISGLESAIFNDQESTFIVNSSIIANNLITAGTSEQNNVVGTFVSEGNNLIGNSNGSSGFNNESDLVGTAENPIDPLLGELQDNGGSTPTQALLDSSPAIDAGSNPENLETDQRGEGFDRTVGDATDIGAFEVQNADGEQPDPQNPNNVLEGTKGKDQIDGTDHDELIFGFAGRDSLNGNGGNDTIFGGKGGDVITGGAGNDSLEGNEGKDEIFGNEGHDTLIGGRGKDTLDGGTGDDLLQGDNGKDVLVGGAGNDTLIGGRGRNTFVLESFDVHDVIADFAPNRDRFQLSDSLSFGQLAIVDDEDGRGALILDSANSDSIIALVENVHAADLDSHVFC